MWRVRGTRVSYRVLVGNPERRRHLKDLEVDRRITLKWILEK
jgi:hypothetical protein